LSDYSRRNSPAADEDEVMPLKHGRTARTIKANVGKNIATERHAHVKPKQAIAIAFATARRDARKAHIRIPKGIRAK
jgi:hypothetical protein